MSAKQESINITPESSLKSTKENNKYYFTYPKSNRYSQQICPNPKIKISNNDLIKHEIKIKTINNLKYQSISTSPSISSSSSNEYFPSTNNNNSKWYYKPSNYIKILIIIILLTILIIGAIYNNKTIKYCQQFLNWMNKYPIRGSFAYIGLYILCSVLMVPGSILTLGAGFVYVKIFGSLIGVISSSIIVWFGATIGSIIAFINGRYLFRNIIIYYTQKSSKFALIDNVVGVNGFKVTFLLRLSPITPYNIFNYFMGLTSIKLFDYSFASIGMIPD
eukprot:259960_1